MCIYVIFFRKTVMILQTTIPKQKGEIMKMNLGLAQILQPEKLASIILTMRKATP
jgi:hypothetical protein